MSLCIASTTMRYLLTREIASSSQKIYQVKSLSGGESGVREGHGFREQEPRVRGAGRRPAQPRVRAAFQRQ